MDDGQSVERIDEAIDLVQALCRVDGKPWMVEALERMRRRMHEGRPGDGRRKCRPPVPVEVV